MYREESDFTMYEYKSIVVPKTMEHLYVDCYGAFGWGPVDRVNSVLSLDSVSLSFMRDRKTKSNIELSRLQTQCDTALRNLLLIDSRKGSEGLAQSLSLGVAAALVLGCGMSLCLTTPYMIPGVLIGIAGIVGCAFPYLVYKKCREKSASRYAVSIDEQYDAISQICERAHALSHASE